MFHLILRLGVDCVGVRCFGHLQFMWSDAGLVAFHPCHWSLWKTALCRPQSDCQCDYAGFARIAHRAARRSSSRGARFVTCCNEGIRWNKRAETCRNYKLVGLLSRCMLTNTENVFPKCSWNTEMCGKYYIPKLSLFEILVFPSSLWSATHPRVLFELLSSVPRDSSVERPIHVLGARRGRPILVWASMGYGGSMRDGGSMGYQHSLVMFFDSQGKQKEQKAWNEDMSQHSFMFRQQRSDRCMTILSKYHFWVVLVAHCSSWMSPFSDSMFSIDVLYMHYMHDLCVYVALLDNQA